MQKNYRRTVLLSASTLVLLYTVGFSQNQPYYKDVLLDGKPARLNVATGEFTVYDTETQTYIYQKPEANETPEPVQPQEEVEETIYHIVEKGESLFDISKRYNVLINTLKTYNNLETTLVAVGQKLRITALPESANADIWTVSEGETLYGIAIKNKMRLSKLKRLNKLRGSTIRVGQKLRLK